VAKSGLVLVYEAMEQFYPFEDLKEQFQRFERAAAKGHEESIWISSVVNGVEMKKSALKEAFAKTEEPLGWYFAGKLSGRREQFDFFKKSAEGGCRWGQGHYSWYFKEGDFVEEDEKVYVEWLEKAANQNNPRAMVQLGYWFQYGEDDEQKAVSYIRTAAEMDWTPLVYFLVETLKDGEGCVRDLRQAAIWSAKGELNLFWDLLADAKRALESGATEDLGCDCDQLCYALGWGLFWHQYETVRWKNQSHEDQAFGNRFLDYYCSCVELQQESIFAFLLCWNQTTGVKGPGQVIAQMVWEGRETNLLRKFEQKQDGKGGCILF
jgi:hypothetical protein